MGIFHLVTGGQLKLAEPASSGAPAPATVMGAWERAEAKNEKTNVIREPGLQSCHTEQALVTTPPNILLLVAWGDRVGDLSEGSLLLSKTVADQISRVCFSDVITAESRAGGGPKKKC